MGIFRMVYFQIYSFAVTASKTEHTFKRIKTILHRSNFPYLLQISSDYVALDILKRKCGTAGSAAQQVGQRFTCEIWIPGSTSAMQPVSDAHQSHRVDRFAVDSLTNSRDTIQITKFCLSARLSQLCVISKFTSQGLLDSAHLDSNTFTCHIIWILFPVWKLLNYTNSQRKHSVLFSNHLSVGVNCTSTYAEEQSPGNLIQYWLSRLRCTFTCHLFSPRPRELTVSFTKANVLVKVPSQLLPHL